MSRAAILLTTLLAAARGEAAAQHPRDDLPIQPGRTIAFETTEGTRMNVDLSPDGRTLIFDLLGDIYTVPISGGAATQLTRGLALDQYPVWSPDGRQIAYVSDASGAENLWVMAADGRNRRPAAVERKPSRASFDYTRFTAVEWASDGKSLVSDDTVYYLAGGKRALGIAPGARVRFSPDGRYAYFSHQGVRRYDRTTGETVQLTRPPVSSIGSVVSPDGRWLAYVTGGADVPDTANGLRVRNLETGEDRWLAYPIDERRLVSYERFVFTPDSRALIIGYGGKLHRIDIAGGNDVIIPFRARIRAELGPFVYHRYRVTNDSLTVRYIRSPMVSPDGKTLVFSALQHLYTIALPHGSPRRLVPRQAAGQFEPAYSPDGKWIAYVTWSDAEGGHVWRVPAAGGRPERLTELPGYYQRPTWAPDGATLAILNAGTKDARPRDAQHGWLQLLPSTGGTPRTILGNVSRATVTFTSDGQRLLINENGKPNADYGNTLVSVRRDGRDRRVLARVFCHKSGSHDWYVVPSPDGRYVAYMCLDDLYLAPLPQTPDPVTLGDSAGAVPVVRLAAHGALDVRWEAEGRMLTWVTGNQVARLDPDRAMAAAVQPDSVIAIRLVVPRHAARGTVALRGARVITMKGDEVLENATVIVIDDRITAVGPAASVVIPKGVEVFDLRGKTIIPGLVDLHAHFTWQEDETFLQHDWRYQTALAYGVTTARDVASNTPQYGDAELIETGRMLGPRLFSVGTTTLLTRIESLDDARAVVQSHKAMGGIIVKQYSQPTRRRRQWVLQAAAEAGLNVTNEGSDLDLVLDGATGVEHAIPEVNVYEDVTRLMAEAKTWYTPTLQVAYGVGYARAYFRDRYRRLFDEPKYRRFVPYDDALEYRRSGRLERPGDQFYKGFVDGARTAAAIAGQGGHVTLGSHGEDQGLGVHWELWALQMGGFTNHEALRAATLRGIEGLGLQQDLGSIEVGKIADLLILDQNPLENIEHSLSIRYVMKNGVLYDGNTLNSTHLQRR